MKKIIRLTESDLTRIVKRVLIEQDEKDPHSDLYGKTVTYKDSQSGVVLKGTISFIDILSKSVIISHNKLYVTEPEVMGYIKQREMDIPSNNSTIYETDFDCKTKTFWITLYEYNNEKIGKQKTISTFTCKGLSDILSQRKPCTNKDDDETDFSMNNDLNTPDNLV